MLGDGRKKKKKEPVTKHGKHAYHREEQCLAKRSGSDALQTAPLGCAFRLSSTEEEKGGSGTGKGAGRERAVLGSQFKQGKQNACLCSSRKQHTHTYIHTYKYVYIRVNVYVRVSARRWHRDTQSVVVSFTRDKNVSANLNVFL